MTESRAFAIPPLIVSGEEARRILGDVSAEWLSENSYPRGAGVPCLEIDGAIRYPVEILRRWVEARTAEWRMRRDAEQSRDAIPLQPATGGVNVAS